LLNEDDARSQELLRAIESLRSGAEIRVNCSDDEVSLPLGFVFEGEVEAPIRKPSRADFAGFWLDRFKITMLVEGSGCGLERRSIDPQRSRLFTPCTAQKSKMLCHISAAIP